MSAPFSHELRVRYGECDPQGIVFNANYVSYVDVCLTELWRELLGSYDAMLERGVNMLVAEINVSFLAPARFDDLLSLQARVEKLGTTSMALAIDIRRDGELLAEARVRYVLVDDATLRKAPIPDWLREPLRRYA